MKIPDKNLKRTSIIVGIILVIAGMFGVGPQYGIVLICFGVLCIAAPVVDTLSSKSKSWLIIYWAIY